MEKCNATAHCSADVIRGATHVEQCEAKGRYVLECIGADGKIKWSEAFDNVVTTVGKNLLLDTGLAGANYSVTGPYLLLITNYTSVNANHTMASHSGWDEFTAYNGNRATALFSSAANGSKALTSAVSFSINDAGTVNGCGMVFGTGAINSKGSTAGTLLSVGAFSGGPKSVGNGDTLNVSYSLSL